MSERQIRLCTMSAQIVEWVRTLKWVTEKQANKFAATCRADKITLNDLANCSAKRRKRFVTLLDVKPNESNKRTEFYKLIDNLKAGAENIPKNAKNAPNNTKAPKKKGGKKNKHHEDEEDDDADLTDDEDDDFEDDDDLADDEESELDESDEDDLDSSDDDVRTKKKEKKKKNSSDSSDDGRESDNEYEMEFDPICDILKKAVDQKVPSATDENKKQWTPIVYWLRSSGKEEKGASFCQIELPKKIAGSIHKIALYCFKDSNGNVCRRLVKVARDSKEDNENHFREEYHAHQRMVPVASAINKCFRITRTDMCVWPVDLVRIEYEGEEHWALAQAPFLTPERNLFCKVEPNHGKPNDRDRMVARYQHAFCALTRGMYIIRDWQGYLVPYSVFEHQSRSNLPEALGQLRERKNRIGTEIFVCIDPVLASYDAHFIFENSTNFGLEAIDDWWENHDCEECRCAFYKLSDDIQFGIADTDQKFFTEKDEKIEHAMKTVAEELDIWTGEPEE